MSGIRINELRLGGLPGVNRAYGAEFRNGDGGGFRPLSIIAGPSQTGKTTIIDFIKYCLGASRHPQKEEIREYVRSALIEVELDGRSTVIERSATGEPSKFALVWEDATLSSIAERERHRYLIEPTGDPESLSQYLLAACNLDNILLPDSKVKDETATRPLSIRDVFDTMFVPNERLDNKSLVFELGNPAKRQKFRQTVDAIFGVHDNQDALLQRRYTNAHKQASNAKAIAEALRRFAEEEHPRGAELLAADVIDADSLVDSLNQEFRALDTQLRANDRVTADLRAQLSFAEKAAKNARVRVRDRESLLARLDALRAQYADDQRKLNFLLDAERLFDPLHITTCPACFNDLVPLPTVEDGTCSLCHNPVPTDDHERPSLMSAEQLGDSTVVPVGEATAALSNATSVLSAELRNINKRLKSLNEYATRLRGHLGVLVQEKADAETAANSAAAAVDAIVSSPAPWIAARDRISQQITDGQLVAQAARAGTNVWQRVADADEAYERLDRNAKAINAQRNAQKRRPDRSAVISALSRRFGEILRDIGYPKLSNPYIADDLVPHVRDDPYTEASSGGMVVIGLAWNLALWEVAHETGADAPGLLVIDSPQKNLGHNSKDGDEDFADSTLVENFYAHVKRWLAAEGAGAQIIVVDNSPPDSVAEDVVVRFTRNTGIAPYGLIPEATG
ncbi:MULTISPECIES: AAA family ATPase [Rhodococcus]|uniref:ATP-binding protein n=1 Tax=Rhodococcus parequi TaxID=3137122 RepID=A0ABW9FGZ1_9NOCA